jgi:hypothetical protein
VLGGFGVGDGFGDVDGTGVAVAPVVGATVAAGEEPIAKSDAFGRPMAPVAKAPASSTTPITLAIRAMAAVRRAPELPLGWPELDTLPPVAGW